MAAKAHVEVNWLEYFAGIRKSCPWSYVAYKNNKILIVDYSPKDFNTWRIFLRYTNYESIVFTCKDVSSDWLNSMCDELNQQDDYSEWLWSHPEHEGDSTPVPVLIQQPKTILEDLRKKVGYYDDNE